MTSEVLMLNKDAAVIAADSAVTTGRHPHPRYSKAANKIFDLTLHGSVAVTIYQAAEIDNVPWELALKQFRHQDTPNPQLPKLEDYVGALFRYLEKNDNLFPASLRAKLLQQRLFKAANYVLNILEEIYPVFVDANKTEEERKLAWESAFADYSQQMSILPIQTPLTHADYKVIVSEQANFLNELTPSVVNSTKYLFVNPTQLAQVSVEALAKKPTDFLNYTGIVLAGYGKDEIFPSFQHLLVYGHIGDSMLWTNYNSYMITHDNDAWIQPFAQSSMIDRFTDGFDSTLTGIIGEKSKESLQSVVADLQAAGIAIPDDVRDPIINKHHADFNLAWKKENWDMNFHPLRRVLNSLSVSEMGHLAESLLVLEALRERVTSPSESVGGPIDVAVITKSEGLLWLKRKHFFDPELNIKYLNRSKAHYN